MTNCLLIYPPIVDPTQPYLALPMLKGHLRQYGLNATVMDWNIEATHFFLQPSQIANICQRLQLRLQELNHKDQLNFLEQCQYQKLLAARSYVPQILSPELKLMDFFQNPEKFYDYGKYLWAKDRIDELWEVWNAVYFPYEYGFNKASHVVAPWDWQSLLDYWQNRSSPFSTLYPELLPNIKEWDVIGISLTFVSQIPEAFYIAQWLRQESPQTFLLLGGSAIHQIFIHGKDTIAKKIFGLIDGIGLYEGEELLRLLLPKISEWKSAISSTEKWEILRDIPNLLTCSPTGVLRQGPLFVTDLTEPALPDYTDLDLDRYMAPSRTLLYAPTRGCYWNKCSFCEYGFSQSGSHAYREIPIETAVTQMGKLWRKYGVKNFYISCDVLSPQYAIRMAEIIKEKNLPLRWNCDLRIEKYYTPERCKILYEGGFKAVAFGIESGSNRVLQMMNKGITVEQIQEINQNFHQAGIATAWMCFNFHPGETFEEAMATIEMIERCQHQIALFIVGEFDMTPGSRIAHCPDEYGVKKIFHAVGDEFKLYPMYDESSKTRQHRAKIDQALARLAQGYNFQKYPWAGAISTHHSLLYFINYNARVFAGTLRRKASGFSGSTPIHLPHFREKYSFHTIQSSIIKFWKKYKKIAFDPQTKDFCPLSITHFNEIALQEQSLSPNHKKK